MDANFSNYSAWHQRALLLLAQAQAQAQAPQPLPPPSSPPLLPLAVLRPEFELVASALFTEPDDQAGWLYHAWLCRRAAATAGADAGADAAAASATLSAEAVALRDLAAQEPACRWPRLGLLELLPALDACRRASGNGGGEGGEWRDEAAALLASLRALDPPRARMYADLEVQLAAGRWPTAQD